MADNTTLPIPPGATSGDVVRDIDRAGVKTQVVQLDIGGAAAESLVTGTLPVSGTFFQATQPVSIAASVAVTGPLTDAQLRASVVPVSLASTTITGTVAATQSGTWNIGTVTTLPALPANQSVNVAQMNGVATTMGNGIAGTGVQRVAIASDNTAFQVIPNSEPLATFRGRVGTFRTPGRAGTTGQKLFALHNATGSTKVVHINQLTVDLMQTVVKAVTVAPPVVRVHRFTAIPTNGTALTKVAKDTALSSNASITAWGDASADGTSSATTLTITIPASSMLTQEFAPRLITAAGYEMFDRTEFLEGKDIVLRALEGIVIFLDYTLATQNPITDMWTATCDWWEV
jgi:hypothetical protein